LFLNFLNSPTMKTLLTYFLFFISLSITAQINNDMPYQQIPDAPESYNMENVIARMIDGLGYRFYTILNVVTGKPNVRPYEKGDYTPYNMREMILKTLEQASLYLRSGEVSIEDLQVVFKRGEQESAYPFWNFLNGQLSDAIYHTGQIVSFRRSARNPLDPTVNVFTGKNRKPRN